MYENCTRPRKRYHLHDIGEGYIIYDKLGDYHDHRGYMIIPPMYGRDRIDRGFQSPQQLVDKLNELDMIANGKLYDTVILTLKDEAFDLVKPKLTQALTDAIDGEPQEIKLTLANMNEKRQLTDEYIVGITVTHADSDLDNYFDNISFTSIMMIINKYIDDLKPSEKLIGESVLTELKMRIMEDIQLRKTMIPSQKTYYP